MPKKKNDQQPLLTPSEVAEILSRRLGRVISDQAVLRRLRTGDVPGAVAHGEGSRRVWTIPNKPKSIDACAPRDRGRPAKKGRDS